MSSDSTGLPSIVSIEPHLGWKIIFYLEKTSSGDGHTHCFEIIFLYLTLKRDDIVSGVIHIL